MTTTKAEDVLGFWLGAGWREEPCPGEISRRWWMKDAAFDAEIAERFGEALEAAGRGELAGWAVDPAGRLALIILLDQLSRNVHRDRAAMYANDARAVALALEGIAQGEDQAIPPWCRAFFYMPLMHAEVLELQEQCVDLFAAMAGVGGDPEERMQAGGQLKFALMHRDIIAQFGRFPHRNAILGRASTAEEEAFLKEPGSSF